MKAANESATAIAGNAARCLSAGADPERIDAFLDQLFELAATVGPVSCTHYKSILRIQSGDRITDSQIPRAKTMLRMACARLAVRCAEWVEEEISPYGATVDVDNPIRHQRFTIRIENTTANQKIGIEFHAPAPTLKK